MPNYSPQFKEQAVRKLLPPHSRSVASVSQETGVSEPTLYAWKKRFQDQSPPVNAPVVAPKDWDAKARLSAVIQSAAMNEVERSAFCRERGLYVEQLDAWRQAFEAMDTGHAPASKTELAQQRKAIGQLKKELQRKNQALAETAALLALSKKAQAIWGINEED